MAAAAVTGFIAKENVVGTLAVCYGVTNFINTDELALTGGATEVAAVFGITKAAALACLMFNLFTPPCFAAIGAMNSEIKDKKWMFAGVGLQFATGYIVAFLIYQIGTLITKGTVGVGFVPGLIAVVVMVGIIVYLMVRADKELVKEDTKNKI
jgi:ferrous iron transport protein B